MCVCMYVYVEEVWEGVVDSNDPFHYGCHYRHVSGEEGILPCHIWSPCQHQHPPLSATHLIKYDHVLARHCNMSCILESLDVLLHPIYVCINQIVEDFNFYYIA